MNKITKTILSIAALITFVAGCSEQPVTPPQPEPDKVLVESVSVSPNYLDLDEGGRATLSVSVLPEDATNSAVTWTTNAPTVVSVDQEGNVEALHEGVAEVRATAKDGSEKYGICNVTVNQVQVPPDPPIDDPVAEYYKDIKDTDTGDVLLGKLRALNKEHRKSTVGYSDMGTSNSGKFKYTDYDPDSVQYDENGQPYGTTIISFYSGNPISSFNREHVWPNTHGGYKVEADIHMTRPTKSSENGSRSHSFYVEGVLIKNGGGWDPAMESFGKEDYRGDSARIIFYCMAAVNDGELILVDDPSRSSLTKNNEMGVISDMLSWNERYPVLDREQRRNEGAEYLQGNRNPFIDHPEYACRIWGLYNDNTKQACGLA